MRLVLATGNAKKVLELSPALAPLGFELVTQGELGIAETPEPYDSFIENALTKARHAAALSGCAALADDSGLCVPALRGLPGVHSKTYAGESGDAGNNHKLIQALQDVSDRSCYYVSLLVLLRHALDPQPLIAQAVWHGEIVDTPAGSNGFGYDPHFYDRELGKTAAQMTVAEKNTRSHRGKAVHELLRQLSLQPLVS
jgi:XTP/dITP diphosphohydrolase